MLKSLKKAELIGTGAALEATDKLKDISSGVEAAWKSGTPEMMKPEKLMTEASAAWLFTYWPDELEETLEKAVADVLHRLDIPERKELEEIKTRIAALEGRTGKNADI